MYKKLLIFIPHIGGGGVEKNFFMINLFKNNLNENPSPYFQQQKSNPV